MCLYFSSVGVKSMSVILADDCISIFHDHTKTATAPSTIIAENFQQHENIALPLRYLSLFLLYYFDACMYSWECDSESLSYSQHFGHNEAQNETHLPLHSFF